MAFGEDAEPAKEFDAQGWSTNHLPMVHIFNRRSILGVFAYPFI